MRPQRREVERRQPDRPRDALQSPDARAGLTPTRQPLLHWLPAHRTADSLRATSLLSLHRTAGNQRVQRLIAGDSTAQRCGGEVHAGCSCADDLRRTATPIPELLRQTVVAKRSPSLARRDVDLEHAEAPETRDTSVLHSPYWADNARLQAAVRNAPPLRTGESGEAVALLQGALVDQGHPMPGSIKPDGTMDGAWGSETTAAVRNFQTEAGVRPVGGWEAGRKTLTALDARMPIRPNPGPLPVPVAVKEGVERFSEIIAGPAATLAFAISAPEGEATPVAGAGGQQMSVPYQGSAQQSVYQVARWLTRNDDRQAAAAAARLLLDSTTKFHIPPEKRIKKGQGDPDLQEFDDFSRREGKVTLLPTSVDFLCKELGVTPKQIEEAVETDKKHGQLRGKADKLLHYGQLDTPLDPKGEKAESRKAGKKRTQLTGNDQVLEQQHVAELYITLLEKFSKPPVSADRVKQLVEGGLTAAELEEIIAKDARRRLITDYFTQGVVEYRQAGGTDLPHQFFLLEEALLDQLTWGNPTAISNELKVGVGIPEQQMGLVHRPDNILYYGPDGRPMTSFAGGGQRDPGFKAASKDPLPLISIDSIPDPAIRSFFKHLHDQIKTPAVIVAMGADAYIDNYEEVNTRVRNGLDKELIDQIEEAVKFLAGFLIVRGASMALKRAQHPWLKALGYAIDASSRIAMYLLDIEFLGSLEETLVNAGYELVHVKPREKPEDSYDAASQYHLEQAAALIRPVIAQVIIMLIQKGIQGPETPEKKTTAKKKADLKLKEVTIEKKRGRIKCSFCELVWEAADVSKERGKELYDAEAQRRRKLGITVKRGEVFKTPHHPGVEVHPDGNVFGPYERVKDFFRDLKLTDRPSNEQSFESHHLLEDHQMEAFGIKPEEGWCVGLERADHSTFSRWMRGLLNRQTPLDIMELHEFSAEMYRDNGHPEYVTQMERFLRSIRGRLIDAYEGDRVPTSFMKDYKARKKANIAWLRSL